MGQTTVALGNAILRNRAAVNEAHSLHGVNSREYIVANVNLRATMKRAKNLFAR